MGGIFQMEETTKVWKQAFVRDRKQEVVLFGRNLRRKLKIEMWVRFLKCLTFDHLGQRYNRHMCPWPPGLNLPLNSHAHH